jgi:TrmH family RNA methyltransferase
MKLITSRNNPQYKELKNLATSAQARKKAQLSILDGVHLCQAYRQHRGAPTVCVVSESSQYQHEVQGILAQCQEDEVPCIHLPDALYQAISQVENGVGVFFVVPTPVENVPEQILKSAVVLDNLQDPGNLGSILRSAAAAGISYVFCSHGTASAWSPKVLRAGMGAHFLLNIIENVDLQSVLQQSKIPILATSSHTENTIYQVNLNQEVIWLFGHEGQGVSSELMQLANETVTIPQNPNIESLNVAASAAICFFEQVRQRVS